MHRLIAAIALSLFFAGCAGSPFRTGIEAEQNRANLLKLNIGLTKEQVLGIMGSPYRQKCT
jgi:outer membrane protein assembly factor BamE (lipoprotein component of BamABCDE complex)